MNTNSENINQENINQENIIEIPESNKSNESNESNESNKICIICLENDKLYYNKLIEYNHCGIYYVHISCLNAWKLNECLICRKKFYYIKPPIAPPPSPLIPVPSSPPLLSQQNNQNEQRPNYRVNGYKIVAIFNILGLGLLLFNYYL